MRPAPEVLNLWRERQRSVRPELMKENDSNQPLFAAAGPLRPAPQSEQNRRLVQSSGKRSVLTLSLHLRAQRPGGPDPHSRAFVLFENLIARRPAPWQSGKRRWRDQRKFPAGEGLANDSGPPVRDPSRGMRSRAEVPPGGAGIAAARRCQTTLKKRDCSANADAEGLHWPPRHRPCVRLQGLAARE